jgi:hypothetical protein
MMERRAKRAARRKDGSRWRSRLDGTISRPSVSRHHVVYQNSNPLCDTLDHIYGPPHVPISHMRRTMAVHLTLPCECQ